MLSSVSRQRASDALNALYRVADTSPTSFTQELTELLRTLIRLHPGKSLTVIRRYARHFTDLEEPWSVLDLLHSEYKAFVDSPCAHAFVKTVFWLLDQYEDFRAERADDFTNVLLNVLHNNDKTLVASSYRTLSFYGSGLIELRDGVTGEHLQDPELSDSVLQLLLRKECLVGRSIIKSLTRLTTSNSDAFFALMKIGVTKHGSAALVDEPFWISSKSGLSHVQKLKLLLIAMQNTGLRFGLAKIPDTAAFLTDLCGISDVEISKLLSTVVRRLVVSEDSLKPFENVEFLSLYIGKCVEVGEEAAIEAAVMCLDRFVKCGFVRDMPKVIPYVKEFLKRKDKVAGYSVGIAASMARFPECAVVMKKTGFARYFETLEKTGNFRKECATFSKGMKSAHE